MSSPSEVKLRDSCGSCAASKVRCSKEKPTCNRCMERGIQCQYTIKQRTGRKFRRRDPISDNREDATSSQTVTPMSSTSPFFPELDPTAGLSLFDSSLGTLNANADLFTSFDSFKAPPSTTNSISLPVNPYQNLLGYPSTCPDNNQSYAVDSCAIDEANDSFQSCEGFLSASREMGPNDEESGLASPLTSSFPTVQPSPLLGVAGNTTDSQQSDSLEAALRLMQQLSCGEDHLLRASLTANGHNHQAAKPLQLQMLIDKNKKAMEAVRSTLQTTCSQDGYLLVVVCLVVSKVVSTYASAVRIPCARESDRRRPSASASSSTLSEKNKNPIAAPQVLDELYRVQASIDQLGAKMQLWAKRNLASGSEAFPIGNNISHTTTPVGFPFSATVLTQLYTGLRKRLSTLSLELIDELKRYWA